MMMFDDDDQIFYNDYYANQAGNGMGYYSGRSYMPQQSGDGIGNFLKSAGKFLTPLLKRGARTIGKNVLSTGVGIVGDLMEGKNFKDSAKTRFTETGKNVMGSLLSEFSGSKGNEDDVNEEYEDDEVPLIRRGKKRKASSSKKKGGKRRKNIFR